MLLLYYILSIFGYDIFHDLNLPLVFGAPRLLLLYPTSSVCGIQHIQRGSDTTSLTMFESVYFVIVTFSTVGYGDISPDIWLGQLFMFVMICVAFAFIPRQVQCGLDLHTQTGTVWP